MRHGMISINGYELNDITSIQFTTDLIIHNPNSQSVAIWQQFLSSLGFRNDDKNNHPINSLFDLIKNKFENDSGENFQIELIEGYITASDGKVAVPHNEMSRIFTTHKFVYIDLLMVNVLFEYIASTYLWARFKENIDIYSFCFGHNLFLFDGCCRKGVLSGDEARTNLVNKLKSFCDDKAIELIADLYWCTLAFAFSHELAHIYLKHPTPSNKEEAWRMEYEADKKGYDIFLKLILDQKAKRIDNSWKVFQEYLYAAPMILLLFYKDLFWTGYWIYGEITSDSHPTLKSRIDNLLEISNSDKYDFDNREGNIVLANFWDVSDLYSEEIFLKLKNGKLTEIIRKDRIEMADNGHEEGLKFHDYIKDEVRQLAIAENVNVEKLSGLSDLSIMVDIVGNDVAQEFIWTYNGKKYSTKAFNVYFRIKSMLVAIFEFGLSVSIPANKPEAVKLGLRILMIIAKLTTIELTDDIYEILKICHEKNAYTNGIIEDELLSMVFNATPKTIDTLCNMGCLRLEDGKVFINERILIKK